MTRKVLENAKYIDIHAHFSINNENEEKNALTIYNFVVNSPSFKDKELKNFPYFFSAGFHPWFLTEDTIKFKDLERICSNSNCLFIGETGLDKIKGPSIEIQTQSFLKHIELSKKLRKPLIIHNVKCVSKILELRKKTRTLIPWIIHDFNGNKEIMKECNKAGIYLSLGNTFLKKENSKIRKDINFIDRSFILFETDESNISIQEVYELFIKELEISPDGLKRQVEANLNRVLDFT